jgi:hypothetical protein
VIDVAQTAMAGNRIIWDLEDKISLEEYSDYSKL